MFGLFIQKNSYSPFKMLRFQDDTILNPFLTTDLHSHLIPGIDDGVKTLEEAKEMVLNFIKMGYKKIITTPHVMNDGYRNSPSTIRKGLESLKNYLEKQNIAIELEAAAEYYLDEFFIKKLDQNEEMLTFGNNHLLFETSFLNKPFFLFEAIFQMKASGYKPVLAHPERYKYIQDNFKFLEEISKKDVLLQINLNSLTGYYGKEAQKTAEKIIDGQMLHFAGSDCHGERHIEALKNLKSKRYYEKLAELKLLNNTL